MKYIFFGTPEFATIILGKLIKTGFIPEAVVCNPDKPMGRKKIITPPPVKLLIARLRDCGIKVYQPEKLEIRNWKLEIGEIKPDFAVVAAYSKILPKEILEIPRLGVIGVHPSLLPKYRGPSPIQTAILNGDGKTGVTLFLMDEKADHGPILAKRELGFPISNFQFPILQQKLAELSADLLIEFLRKIKPISNQSAFDRSPTGRQLAISNLVIPQDESQATYTKKFTTQDAYIEPIDLEKAEKDGGQTAIEIERKIRAFNPEPGAWTYANALTNRHMRIGKNKRMKILEAELTDEHKLRLKKIQFEGKKPVEI